MKRDKYSIPLCFYHGDDLDGHCGGAVVARALGATELVPISYDSKFPFELCEDRDVVMVDFSLPPIGMEKILLGAREFIWIDHHVTAIEKVREYGNLDDNLPGLRDLNFSGCELAWKFFFPTQEMPDAVRLLGRWDVWDHEDPAVRPFQYSMRSRITRPHDEQSWALWAALLEDDYDTTKRVLDEGEAIVRYIDQEFSDYATRGAFLTELEGIPAVAINRIRGGSELFNSIRTPERPLEITFGLLPGGKWIVSLYGYGAEVHCGELARKYGGGGHKGAAGFIWPLGNPLPFEVSK